MRLDLHMDRVAISGRSTWRNTELPIVPGY